jgi:uncharacterized protein (DUF2336 family)
MTAARDCALTPADVQRLLVDPSAEMRIRTMTKMVRDLEKGTFDEREKALAHDILNRFAADAEAAVREAVAWQIHNSPLLTEALATRLARDVGRVAFPILRHAARLDDDFLLDVIGERDAEKQLAIAGRQTVSPELSDALVDSGNVVAITCLVRNKGAQASEPSLHKAIDRFGAIRAVNEALAARAGLSMALVEKLIAYVSEEIRETLVRQHKLAPYLVRKIIERGRESATLLMLEPFVGDGVDLEPVARQLDLHGRLTPYLLFRALCAGDIDLFVAGMAVRSRIGIDNAHLLIWDDGPLGLRAIFDKARLPIGLLPPFRVALGVAKQTGYRGGEAGRPAFQADVIAQVFDACAVIEERQIDDLLLQLFDQKSGDVIEQAMIQAGLPFLPVRTGNS